MTWLLPTLFGGITITFLASLDCSPNVKTAMPAAARAARAAAILVTADLLSLARTSLLPARNNQLTGGLRRRL